MTTALNAEKILAGIGSEIGSGSIAWAVAEVFDAVFGSDGLEKEILEKLDEVLATEHQILEQLRDLVTQDIWDTLQAEAFPAQNSIANFFQEYRQLAQRRQSADGSELDKLRAEAQQLRDAILQPDDNGVNSALVALNDIISGTNPLDDQGGLLQTFVALSASKLAQDPTSGSLTQLGQSSLAYLTSALSLQWMGIAMLVSAHLSRNDPQAARAVQETGRANFDAQVLVLAQTIPPLAHAMARGVVACRVKSIAPPKPGQLTWTFDAPGHAPPVAIVPPAQLDGTPTNVGWIQPPSSAGQGNKIFTDGSESSNPIFFQRPPASGIVWLTEKDETVSDEAEAFAFRLTTRQSESVWYYRFGNDSGQVVAFSGDGYPHWAAPPHDEVPNATVDWDVPIYSAWSLGQGDGWAIDSPSANATLAGGARFRASGTSGTLPDDALGAWLMVQGTTPGGVGTAYSFDPGAWWAVAYLGSSPSKSWSVEAIVPVAAAVQMQVRLCLVLVDAVSHATATHQLTSSPNDLMPALPGGVLVAEVKVDVS